MRIVDEAGGELIGYTDRWSAQPGEAIELMVSTTAATFDVAVVRLRHGDPSPAGPGVRMAAVATPIDGTYPGGVQELAAGSYAVIEDDTPARTVGVWAWPTRPAAGREQVLLARGEVAIVLDGDGRPGLRVGDALAVGAAPLARERWVELVATLGEGASTLAVAGEVVATAPGAAPVAGRIVLARGYDGRLEAPFADARSWDLRAAELVNAPTVAVTGRRWQDDTTDFRAAPDEYAAVHFHTDDLADAGWRPALALRVPAELASGVYAFALTAGGLTDHVPFVVRPAVGRPGGSIGLLLPTLTYQAYGNERLLDGGEGAMTPLPAAAVLDPADVWLARRRAAGASCYDHHPDGHGISLVSQRRPLPNVRPSYRWWLTGAPERFGADLYLVDWLDEQGAPYDVFTDHDVHADGHALLAGYRVVLTGTHPEYCSRAMLDALSAYLDGGGRLMYLGGNGFYWVTSIDPERPHLAEVRRGVNGTRAWSSRPGELRHQTTGEQGGLWRYRGRDPNRLVGVGFSAQSDAHDRAPGYVRTAAGHTPEHAWVFAGVDGDVIGEHGLYLGGAAGYEIDRHDPAHGSPPDAVVLATSAGRHPPSYLLVVEDMEVTVPEITGAQTDRVRADLTYLPYPNGGAVFAVGSCSWCGSLGTDGYANDVAQITGNVLRRFMR